MAKARKLYSSSNGDRWYLVQDASGEVYVRHEANAEAGGTVAHIELGAFLSEGRRPEHQELRALIATPVEKHPAYT